MLLPSNICGFVHSVQDVYDAIISIDEFLLCFSLVFCFKLLSWGMVKNKEFSYILTYSC